MTRAGIVLGNLAGALALVAAQAVWAKPGDGGDRPGRGVDAPYGKRAAPSEEPEPDADPAPAGKRGQQREGGRIAAAPAPDISVTDRQMLSIVTGPNGQPVAQPATTIPYLVGRSCYNWLVKFRPVPGDLTLTEELILPGRAGTWGTDPGGDTQVNRNGAGAVTERHFDGRSGVATAGWCVAQDDPVGPYRYIIRQGNREVARFDFMVGDRLL